VLYCASVPRRPSLALKHSSLKLALRAYWTYPAIMAYNSKFNPDRLPAHAEPDQVWLPLEFAHM